MELTEDFYEPFDYQEKGTAFLQENRHAALFVDMGLGKTSMTLCALADLPGPTLLVAPKMVCDTVWAQEAPNFEATHKLTFSRVGGSPKQRAEARRVKADIYLVNPEDPNVLEESLLDPPDKLWCNLVVDESTFFKNSSSKRFKVLRRHLKDFHRRWILTGMPTPNSLEELWSQIYILDKGERLDTAKGRFMAKYFYQADYMGYDIQPHDWAKDEILEQVQDLVYRMERNRALEDTLPKENLISCPLPPRAWARYREMEKLALIKLGKKKKITAKTAATKLMKLRQLASGFSYDDNGQVVQVHTAKLEALSIMVEQLQGDPLVVIYQFNHERDAILRRLQKKAVVFDKKVQKRWNKGKIPVLLLHPQSAGHGVNLQKGGCNIVVFSGSFSYEQMHQAFGRVDRTGQKRQVVIHSLIAPGTVDEMLQRVIEAKEAQQANVLQILKEYTDARRPE